MSIAVKVARARAWTIATTIGSRAIGTLATLVLTYFLSPEVIGEVGIAYVVVLTAHFVSNLVSIATWSRSRPAAPRIRSASTTAGTPIANADDRADAERGEGQLLVLLIASLHCNGVTIFPRV